MELNATGYSYRTTALEGKWMVLTRPNKYYLFPLQLPGELPGESDDLILRM